MAAFARFKINLPIPVCCPHLKRALPSSLLTLLFWSRLVCEKERRKEALTGRGRRATYTVHGDIIVIEAYQVAFQR